MTLAHVACAASRAPPPRCTTQRARRCPAAARERVRGARGARTVGSSWWSTPGARRCALSREPGRPLLLLQDESLRPHPRARRRDTIASGTNRDDLVDFRPGLARRARSATSCIRTSRRASTRRDVYALARRLGLDDLERLPAQPCLASRVETGIAIDPADLAFIDAVESRGSRRSSAARQCCAAASRTAAS